jgi:Fe-S-cluster containining protein
MRIVRFLQLFLPHLQEVIRYGVPHRSRTNKSAKMSAEMSYLRATASACWWHVTQGARGSIALPVLNTAVGLSPCKECGGECCTNSNGDGFGALLVHDFEADHVRRAGAPLRPRPKSPGEWWIHFDEGGRCPMLINGRCSIYRSRPVACRNFQCTDGVGDFKYGCAVNYVEAIPRVKQLAEQHIKNGAGQLPPLRDKSYLSHIPTSMKATDGARKLSPSC